MGNLVTIVNVMKLNLEKLWSLWEQMQHKSVRKTRQFGYFSAKIDFTNFLSVCGNKHTLVFVPTRGRVYAFGLGKKYEMQFTIDFIKIKFLFF